MARKPRRRGSWWRKNGKGPVYRGTYMHDEAGERQFVLFRLRRNGKMHNRSYESANVAKETGWKKVK